MNCMSTLAQSCCMLSVAFVLVIARHANSKWLQWFDVEIFRQAYTAEINFFELSSASHSTVQAQRTPFDHTSSHVAQKSWRPAEDIVNHEQGRPRASLRKASLRLRTIEKGMGESFQWARTWPSSLGCLRPRCGQIDWWCRLNPPRVNAATSTIK